MLEYVRFILGTCDESAARVYLRPLADVDLRSVSASLRGPSCRYSRTLAADFTFQNTSENECEALVTEPCYWTPALPFLYSLNVKVTLETGQEIEQTVDVGLRRWDCVGNGFRLETKRIVLRGAMASDLSEQTLAEARDAESALIVADQDSRFSLAANSMGVVTVIDLRTIRDPLFAVMDQLDHSPSIVLALVDVEQLTSEDFTQHWPSQCLLAHCLTAKAEPEELIDPNTEAVAVELGPNERPPSWLADIDRPVIAIRRGVEFADLHTARAACDKLQAELAPEFNLAGYFVAQ